MYRVWGISLISPVVEHQMKKNIEKEMAAGVLQGFYGVEAKNAQAAAQDISTSHYNYNEFGLFQLVYVIHNELLVGFMSSICQTLIQRLNSD